MNSKAVALSVLLAMTLCIWNVGLAQESLYDEGSVWVVSFIKVKPGNLEAYLRDIASDRRSLLQEAKNQGLLLSDKILVGRFANRDDWDLMFMEEYKNWAAFDGINAKLNTLMNEKAGGEVKQSKLIQPRTELRELIGDKILQEIKLK